MSKEQTFYLGYNSKRALIGVNPLIAFAVTQLIKTTPYDFTVFEGVRLKERQRRYVREGVSWTLDSHHLTGNAVDLVIWFQGRAYWENTGKMTNIDEQYKGLSEAFKEIIKTHKLPIVWGFDLWKKDLAHWQISAGLSGGWDIKEHFNQDQMESLLGLRR